MSIYLYIAAMALTTYLVRLLPMTLFRRPIRSRFLKSFLHYVPYACLSAMTFPTILSSNAGNLVSGIAALATAIFLAYRGKSLIVVALSSSAAVLVTQLIMKFL